MPGHNNGPSPHDPEPTPFHAGPPAPEHRPEPVNNFHPRPEHHDPGPVHFDPNPDPFEHHPDFPQPIIYSPVETPVTAGQTAYTAYAGSGTVEQKWQNAADAVRNFYGLSVVPSSGDVLAKTYTTVIGNPKLDLGTFWGWGSLKETTQTAWESASEAVRNLQ
jgi:hypothetical protein